GVMPLTMYPGSSIGVTSRRCGPGPVPSSVANTFPIESTPTRGAGCSDSRRSRIRSATPPFTPSYPETPGAATRALNSQPAVGAGTPEECAVRIERRNREKRRAAYFMTGPRGRWVKTAGAGTVAQRPRGCKAEHRSGPSAGRGTWGASGVFRGGIIGCDGLRHDPVQHGQLDAKRRPAFRPVEAGNLAAVLLHDPVADGKAQ